MDWIVDDYMDEPAAMQTRMRVGVDAHARLPGAAGASGPESAKASTRPESAKEGTCMRVQPDAHARQLDFKSDADNATHEGSCESKKTCPWCNYLAFQKKWGAHFRMLDEDKANGERRLDKKQRAIAAMSWLGKAHAADGEVLLGCVACNAIGVKALGNPLASFAVPAARLLQGNCKPHVLLRHATCKLHIHAVSKFLGLGGGAPALCLKLTFHQTGHGGM